MEKKEIYLFHKEMYESYKREYFKEIKDNKQPLVQNLIIDGNYSLSSLSKEFGITYYELKKIFEIKGSIRRNLNSTKVYGQGLEKRKKEKDMDKI